MYYPGWKAMVDGNETAIFRADYNLRGLFLPQGTHSVEIVYEPASYRRGMLGTLATLLVCAAGIVFPAVRRRRPGTSKDSRTSD
jgi:uncharacterized membrane protein YfhO